MNLRENKQPPILIKIQRLCRTNTSRFHLTSRETVAEVCKPVEPGLFRPRSMEVFPARILDRLQEVERRITIYSDNWPVNRAALVPAPTILRPNSALEILLHVLVVFLIDIMSHFEALDGFGLQLLEPFVDVHRSGSDAENQQSVADGAAGASEGEVVGHIRNCEAKVGLGLVEARLLCKIDSVAADERERRLEGCIEAGGTDDNVVISHLTRPCDNAIGRDGLDIIPEHLDVLLCQRLIEAGARRLSTASDREAGKKKFRSSAACLTDSESLGRTLAEKLLCILLDVAVCNSSLEVLNATVHDCSGMNTTLTKIGRNRLESQLCRSGGTTGVSMSCSN
jgi:hypothetical protein